MKSPKKYIRLKPNGNYDVRKMSNKKEVKKSDLILIKDCNRIGPVLRIVTGDVFDNLRKQDLKATMKYDFVNGYNDYCIEEYAINERKIKGKIYNILRELDTISINEYILNRFIWMYSDCYCYYYRNFRISTSHKGKKTKYNDGTMDNFYDKYSISKNVEVPDYIVFKSKDKYTLCNEENIKTFIKTKKASNYKYFIRIYGDLYIKIDYSLIKDINSILYKTIFSNEGDIFDETITSSNGKLEWIVEEFIETYLCEDFLGAVISGENIFSVAKGYPENSITVKNKIKQINGKKTKMKPNKFAKKYIHTLYKHVKGE